VKADLTIVGGGPAGLAAAAAAAAQGVDVVVVDESPVPGGRLNIQLHELPGPDGRPHWVRGAEEAQRLLAEAQRVGVRILSSTPVWGVFPGWTLALSGAHGGEELESKAVVLATGASQRSLAMPGWTLPGVLAIGAVQAMVNQYRIRPGKRTLVIGIDVLSLSVARQLALVGTEVVGLVLPPPGLLSGSRAQPAAIMAELLRFAPLAPSPGLRAAGRLTQGFQLGALAARLYPRRGVRVWGVPVLARQAAIAIEGDGVAESVVLADLTASGEVIPGSERREAVDFVCLSGGLSPLAELALQVGCESAYLEELGGHVPLHGPDMATSVPSIFVAGNITGVEGAPVAEAQGRLAGLAAAAALGAVAEDLLDEARGRVEAARSASPLSFHPNVKIARQRLAALWANRSVPAG
jgi:sarcosine oxidase subunit alpha